LDQLNVENDRLAIVSPSDDLRSQLGEVLINRYRAVPFPPSLDAHTAEMWPELFSDRLWPEQVTVWLSFSEARDRMIVRGEIAVDDTPKLTVLLTPETVDLFGRGPTLTLQTNDWDEIEREVTAAIQSVWPDLG
jgi:hypothetical protein